MLERLGVPFTVRAAQVPEIEQGGGPDHCGTCGKAKVDLTFNWDPARRLRFYQFDPTHHDVAIFSVIDEDWPEVRALLERRLAA